MYAGFSEKMCKRQDFGGGYALCW